MFKQKLCTVSYIEDISSGISYERIKARQDLFSSMNDTLHKKLSSPLNSMF